MHRKIISACVAAALGVAFAPPPASAAENPDASILKSARFGEWETWCVKRHVEPRPDCFVVNAVVYSPRPNFAALVLYFRPPGFGRATPSARLGMEAQSALAPGHIRIDGEDALSSTQCLLPGTCTLSGDSAGELIAKLSAGASADWRHYDYGVRPVDITLDLSGFEQAYAQTAAWIDELGGAK